MEAHEAQDRDVADPLCGHREERGPGQVVSQPQYTSQFARRRALAGTIRLATIPAGLTNMSMWRNSITEVPSLVHHLSLYLCQPVEMYRIATWTSTAAVATLVQTFGVGACIFFFFSRSFCCSSSSSFFFPSLLRGGGSNDAISRLIPRTQASTEYRSPRGKNIDQNSITLTTVSPPCISTSVRAWTDDVRANVASAASLVLRPAAKLRAARRWTAISRCWTNALSETLCRLANHFWSLVSCARVSDRGKTPVSVMNSSTHCHLRKTSRATTNPSPIRNTPRPL
mmetsp:Transcript_16703/g.41139  ORF Transcript_16703/g.41139 Transcript_16703/m.41139 type:complete len:284 (-) Transcript_16703:89-940(-)